MNREPIITQKAPQAIGAYSQGIQTNNFIFLSMQLGIDPIDQKLVKGGIESQFKQIIFNMTEILKKAGVDLSHVVKTTLLIKDMTDFKKIDEIYSVFFQIPYPARSVFAVKELPLSADVAVEAFAIV